MIAEKKRVATSAGEIAYVDRGAGPVALFVHGVFLNSYLWRHVIDRVAGVRRCLAVDLLSHGDSPSRPDQDISFRGQAAMLEAFCGALGLDEVDLVANDSGGAIAQIFAARHPERIRTLTLTNCDVHDNYPPRRRPAGSRRAVPSTARMWECFVPASPWLTRTWIGSPMRRCATMWGRSFRRRRECGNWNAGSARPATAAKRSRSSLCCASCGRRL
jgi:pimeloyl-ACP methyl ester carboxylesterase